MSTQAQSTMPQQIARFSTCRRPGLWRCSSERPPQLWKLRRLGAMAPEGLRTRISHVSSPEGPPLKILPEGQNRQITEEQRAPHTSSLQEHLFTCLSFLHSYIGIFQCF